MTITRVGLTLLFIALFVVALSALFHVPFVFGLFIAFAWPIFGMIVTADGGQPPANTTGRPWAWFVLAVALAIAVGAVIVLFPAVRTYGF